MVDTVARVPRSRRTTPPRSTQIEDEPWIKFGEDAAAIGMTRSAVIRELVLWWIRWPGAKMPKRPPA